jgi:outer membrane lipoprotein carrier protein
MKKNTLLIHVFFLACTLCSGQSFLPMKDSKGFQEKLHSIATKTTTMKSDFVQIKHLDVLSEDIESNGKLYFKSESNLRWEYTAPLDYLIILRNGRISIKDEGKVSSYDLSGNKTFQKINEMVINSLQGHLLVDQGDYKYDFKESSASFMVLMYPKEKKVQEFLQSIKICFSKKDYSVEQVQMMERSGDFTLMKFKNKKINEKISDQTFIIN